MLVQFEAADGTVLERSEQVVNPSALPVVIAAAEGGYWFHGVRITADAAFLPAYRLAREVSGAKH